MSRLVVLAAVCLGIICTSLALSWSTNVPTTVPYTTDATVVREYWERHLSNSERSTVYREFIVSAESHPLSQHDHAHLFGEALYAVDGLAGFSTCDDEYEFGCFHSFIGAAILDHGIDVIDVFNTTCREAFGSTYFPCHHGIGHGLLVYYSYENLSAALDKCSTISTNDTGGCYSGVFMEYNFHTMESEGVAYIRPANENLFSPCDQVSTTYQPACYYEQVQWWEVLYQSEWETVIDTCSEVKNYQMYCMQAIGHYAVPWSNYNLEKVVAVCDQILDSGHRSECLLGASWQMTTRNEEAATILRTLSLSTT